MPPFTYADAIAEGVNVDHAIYRINTRITSAGSRVDSGYWIDKRDRLTRARRAVLLDTDLAYTAQDLNRDVVALDQIRTVVREFRDKLFTDIFPGRTEVPKTLVFARDDSHADDIVQVIREEFGKGNDFCQKITYRTGKIRQARQVKCEDGTVETITEWIEAGEKPDSVLALFRTSYNPRIVVTVDMIATGTDVKPLEILFFLRDVRSLNYFGQPSSIPLPAPAAFYFRPQATSSSITSSIATSYATWKPERSTQSNWSPRRPAIAAGKDSLAAKPSVNYDMVLTNPPFGKKSSITVINEEGEESK